MISSNSFISAISVHSKLILSAFSLRKYGILLLLTFLVTNILLYSLFWKSDITVNGSISTCRCVVFRLDDIPYDRPIYDKNRINVDLAVMDVFNNKNQSVSLGLVMHYINHSPGLVKKIQEGQRRGIFELALHGWNHVNYSKLSEKDQEQSLRKANIKMHELFGSSSIIFISPYTDFNDSTLVAMKKLGIKILSASDDSDHYKYFIPNQTKKDSEDDQIYHLPQMAAFEDWEDEKPIRIPNDQILRDVDHYISKYGYAIVTIHPQSFLKFREGDSTSVSLEKSVLDPEQIEQLNALVQSILDKKIRITSFSKLVGTD
jgi:peptidoglycan/xylan/chitin deacetylase (PgdA/CDA1 family)